MTTWYFRVGRKLYLWTCAVLRNHQFKSFGNQVDGRTTSVRIAVAEPLLHFDQTKELLNVIQIYFDLFSGLGHFSPELKYSSKLFTFRVVEPRCGIIDKFTRSIKKVIKQRSVGVR